MNKTRYMLAAASTVCGGSAIWFIGWLLWSVFNTQLTLTKDTFTQILLLATSLFIGTSLFLARPKSLEISPRDSNSKPKRKTKNSNNIKKTVPIPENSNNNQKLEDLENKVEELLIKQTDINAIMRFFKTREQKDSVRRPVKKSVIKLEAPGEILKENGED